MGSILEVEASGTDESEAIAAIEKYFVESAEDEADGTSEVDEAEEEQAG